MVKNKRIALCVSAALLVSFAAGCAGKKEGEQNKSAGENTFYTEKEDGVALAKSEGTNPIIGERGTLDYFYGGDPSVLVDGDTVYLYVGHDESSDAQVQQAIYNMKNYLCFSSTDLLHWKDEGSVMEIADVEWADMSSAWASQVVKYKDKYYLYFCSWDNQAMRKQSIGVAVSDSPTGPFVDIGHSLVPGTMTTEQANDWEDIDPTVWIDTDENGEEHRYLAWGNSRLFVCELNEDMISVKDYNGDGEITYAENTTEGDIVHHQNGLRAYTEAPWLYRRQDENGNYYGDYYLFYANGWFENMAYATIEDPMEGTWNFGKIIMSMTPTSNTNHMAVFDFKGQTYFMYHNGSLPAGNGYRRSACLTRLEFNEKGGVEYIRETAAGLGGVVMTVSAADGSGVAHEHFNNAATAKQRPYLDLSVGTKLDGTKDEDFQWVFKPGKADMEKETYVSIEAETKPGLYLTAAAGKETVVLSQNTDASEETAKAQTFHTVKALDGGDGVSFESVANEGKYITVNEKGSLCLTDGSAKENASFQIDEWK